MAGYHAPFWDDSISALGSSRRLGGPRSQWAGWCCHCISQLRCWTLRVMFAGVVLVVLVLWGVNCHWWWREGSQAPGDRQLNLLTHWAGLPLPGSLLSLPPIPPPPALLLIMKKLGPHPAGMGRGTLRWDKEGKRNQPSVDGGLELCSYGQMQYSLFDNMIL
jgi:hypothetical protein